MADTVAVPREYLEALESFYLAFRDTDWQCSEYECYMDMGPLDAAADAVDAVRKEGQR